MANESIFKFGDKFGYESPFGDWLKKERNDFPQIVSVEIGKDLYKVLRNKGVIEEGDKNKIIKAYYQNENGSLIIPVYVEIITKGYLSEVTVKYSGKSQTALKFSENTYRAAFELKILPPNDYVISTFFTTIYDVKNKIIQERITTFKIFIDGNMVETSTTTEQKNECPCDKEITIETIQNISALIKVSNIKKRIKGLNEAFVESEINTCLRRVHFLAQVLHETGYLRLTAEAGKTDADYKGFKGRGLIQLTSKENYKGYQNFSGVDVTSSTTNKQKLEKYPHAARAAAWYWNKKENLNWYADQNDFIMITRKINGGFNGWDDRMEFLKGATKELTKNCDKQINTDYRLSGSNAYYDVWTCLRWALWHDPDLKIGKGITKSQEKAIEGYQRVTEIANEEINFSNIHKMKAFENIRYKTDKGNVQVDVKEAAETRLKSLKK